MITEIIDAVPNFNGMDQQQFAGSGRAGQVRGCGLIGPGGLLTALTKSVLETALEAELTQHQGYSNTTLPAETAGNSRNGTRIKTVFASDRAG
jgi:putative transposase